MTDRYCRSCTFCVRSMAAETVYDALRHATCGAIRETDPVTGTEARSYCANERAFGHKCGPDGKLWVEKPATPRERVRADLVDSLAVTAR